MGRRSINTTKSGKFMNPTDQARKIARKKELKKNKKQRLLVRTAVIKGKDPHQVLADLERLDAMEFNVDAPPPLNEKVLKDKRRKLKETWDRVCRLYCKEDKDKYLELKRLEGEYEAKRSQLVKFYESVKSAQEVSLDEIPLPSAPLESSESGEGGVVGEIFQLSYPSHKPAPILKKGLINFKDREPPGLPPGPPPRLDEFEDGDSDDDEDETSKKVRFGESEKEADLNEFLKEIEDVEKSVAEAKDVNDTSKAFHDKSKTNEPILPMTTILTPTRPITSLGPAKIQPAPQPIPPPVLLLRPPLQPRSIVASQMRPGMLPPGSATGPPRTGVMIPPPQHYRPMGHPANQLRQNHPRPQHQSNRNQTYPKGKKDENKQAQTAADKATIEAKPQLRNLSADATRFTPLTLRVKRPEKQVRKPPKTEINYEVNYGLESTNKKEEPKVVPTKDDAYEEFMKELKDII